MVGLVVELCSFWQIHGHKNVVPKKKKKCGPISRPVNGCDCDIKCQGGPKIPTEKACSPLAVALDQVILQLELAHLKYKLFHSRF